MADGTWPAFDDEMAQAVTRVLQSGKVNYWTGDEGKSFEKEFAAFLGIPHAVALSNGTVALELALQALGIGPGDDVVVTPRTFIASASAIVARGARPVFADVDRDSGNITAATVAAAQTPQTRAMVVVHMAGWPCEMDELLALARSKNLKVVEDVAQATGGTYRGKPLGTLGDVGAFSFCQDKIITTAGEGGMIVTRDSALWERIWSLKDHGKSYEACFKKTHPVGFRWLHEDFGTNGRMTEVQSAIGRIALRRLPGWLEERRLHAKTLTDVFSKIPALRVPTVPAHAGHAWYKYYAYVRPENLKQGWSRDRILAELSQAGVPAMSGTCTEIYLEKAFEKAGLRPQERLPVARELGETALMFLVHPGLPLAEMEKGTRAVRRAFELAAR